MLTSLANYFKVIVSFSLAIIKYLQHTLKLNVIRFANVNLLSENAKYNQK